MSEKLAQLKKVGAGASGGNANFFVITMGNGYNQAVNYDGNTVTCASTENAVPRLTNAFVDISSSRILKKCSCYASTDGAAPTKTDYNVNDVISISPYGVRSYTFVSR